MMVSGFKNGSGMYQKIPEEMIVGIDQHDEALLLVIRCSSSSAPFQVTPKLLLARAMGISVVNDKFLKDWKEISKMPAIDEYTIDNKSEAGNPKTLGPLVARNFLKKSKFFLADEENLPMDKKLFSQMIEHAGGIVTDDSSQKSGKFYMIGKHPRPGSKVYNANWIMRMMMKGSYVNKESYVCEDEISAESDEKNSQPITLLNPKELEESKPSNSTVKTKATKNVLGLTTGTLQDQPVAPLPATIPAQMPAYPPLQMYQGPVYMQAPHPQFCTPAPYNPGYPGPQYQQVAPAYPFPGFAVQNYPPQIPIPTQMFHHQPQQIGLPNPTPPLMYPGSALHHLQSPQFQSEQSPSANVTRPIQVRIY